MDNTILDNVICDELNLYNADLSCIFFAVLV